MSIIPAGSWVEIEQQLIAAGERAPSVPQDTQNTPYMLRMSGFLLNEAKLGEQVIIRTMIGRKVIGILKLENPSYRHGFGDTVPELLDIGLGGKV